MDLDLSVMRETAPKVSALMKILANENRLMILCQLVECERSVSEMAAKLEMRQAAVSAHASLRSRKTSVSATTLPMKPSIAIFLSSCPPSYGREVLSVCIRRK